MAKNITLLGASYTGVPGVLLPQTGGGTALFTDVGDTTAVAADVSEGKIFYAADGSRQVGTSTGGGNDFVITLSKNTSTDVWEPDCTFTEAQAAYNGGKNIVFVTDTGTACTGAYAGGAFYYGVEEGFSSADEYGFYKKAYVWDSTGISDDGSKPYYSVFNATAVPADVASGKAFYNGSGYQVGIANGGESPWTLIKSQEITVSTTETSAKTAATISCGSEISTKDKIVWVHIRDKAGKRAGYFYGSDSYFVNTYRGNGSATAFAAPACEYIRVTTSGTYTGVSGQYGVWGYSISSTGSLIIRRRYNSTNTLTIDGTFQVDVYTLDLPDGLTLFD